MAQKEIDAKYEYHFTSGSLYATTGSGNALAVSGFDRVKHFIPYSNRTGNSGSPAIRVLQSATASGTYAIITSGSSMTTTNTAGSALVVIDVPTSATYPFQKVTIDASSGSLNLAVVSMLYGGSRTLPPTQTTTEVLVD
jgi:hypothetical protein